MIICDKLDYIQLYKLLASPKTGRKYSQHISNKGSSYKEPPQIDKSKQIKNW